MRGAGTLWDDTHEIVNNLNLYGEGGLGDFDVGDETAKITINTGFDWDDYEFPSMYYTMSREGYIADWQERERKRKEELRQAQIKFEEENKKRAEEKEYQYFLELKQKFKDMGKGI